MAHGGGALGHLELRPGRMMDRPSSPQLQALQDTRDHHDPWCRVRGMSQHGGWYRVMLVLEHRRKWVRYVRQRWELTAEGARVLRQEEARLGRPRGA
jgi:hypothetical protein